ncbi:MAG: T9SS type A sorting domain-containing protein [Bacteroidetes bacterium]|nr:T9SS type A sorting domain-containing protein [Bacteroidota bacterium]
MKTIISWFFTIIFSTFLFAQQDEFQLIPLKEQKSNFQKMLLYNNNPNTQNYDLRYQRMEATLDPAVNYITSAVTSHFIPNASMSSIYFDFTNQLVVSSVTYHGANITFSQLPTKELKIDFPVNIPAATLDSLTVNYAGIPDPSGDAFAVHNQSGVPVMSTLSEPYGAQDWFPTKQSMNDKIEKFDMKITTPSQYSVASNGKLISETTIGNNKLTFWRTQYPTAAYLIAFSITNFVKINDVIGNPPFPFVNYIYPSTAANTSTMSDIEWTKQVMNTFENYFGPYPFRNEKYGHMEFGYNGVCMEHQTMSSMNAFPRRVVAHELAHQWFGDKITCGAWNDLWLNEGFAVFGEHLANEKLLMTPTEFLSYLQGQKNFITSSPGGSVYVSDSNLGNQNTLFSGRLTYSKGGFVARMIKWILGDVNYYQAIKDYMSRPNLAYKYAVTSDLNNSLLLSTGKDFTEFFNQWIYGEGYPIYTIKWKQATNLQSITILASQTTSHPSVSFFKMPLPIKVNGNNGEVAYFKLENTINNQYFTLPISFSVSSVEFNYEYQILESNSIVQQDNSLSTQEIKGNSEILIYPNPAHNEISIQGIIKNTPYKLFFSTGQLIQKGIYQPKTTIDISHLEKGIYIIEINSEKLKFIKNK